MSKYTTIQLNSNKIKKTEQQRIIKKNVYTQEPWPFQRREMRKKAFIFFI